jgi:hypothetical protein
MIQSPELWVYLAPEQQQKVMRVMVNICRQIVQRLATEQEEQNED